MPPRAGDAIPQWQAGECSVLFAGPEEAWSWMTFAEFTMDIVHETPFRNNERAKHCFAASETYNAYPNSGATIAT